VAKFKKNKKLTGSATEHTETQRKKILFKTHPQNGTQMNADFLRYFLVNFLNPNPQIPNPEIEVKIAKTTLNSSELSSRGAKRRSNLKLTLSQNHANYRKNIVAIIIYIAILNRS